MTKGGGEGLLSGYRRGRRMVSLALRESICPNVLSSRLCILWVAPLRER
jgi:hypothetical protein